MRVLLVCDPRNLLAFHWAYALAQCSHTTGVFCLDASQVDRKQQVGANFKQADIGMHWSGFDTSGLRKNLAALAGKKERLSAADRAYIEAFSPDLIVSWWGLSTYAAVNTILDTFSTVPYIPIVSTYPNAYTALYHRFENALWRSLSAQASGYVFYSGDMEDSFRRKIGVPPHAPSINVIDPQPAFQFAALAQTGMLPEPLKLQRYDARPHVILSGTVDYLRDRRASRRKDALSEFIAELAARQVHVFLGHTEQLAASQYVHPSAYFPLDTAGTFSAYLNQFDAHIVVYNEFNRMIQARVANGLGTRYSFAQTAVCPIAVSAHSRFAVDEFNAFGIGFTFNDTDDLARKVADQAMLQQIRSNILLHRDRLTFEARYKSALSAFLLAAAARPARH